MKKFMKNTVIFTSVLILSLVVSVLFLGSRVKAKDLGDGSVSVEYTPSKMEEYYGKELPTYEGEYLFAGWYADEDCKVSYVKETATETFDKYYAKFVPSEVLSVKAQHETKLHNVVLKDGTTEESESIGLIRFTTATDSGNYKQVGLHVEGTIGTHTLGEDYVVPTIYEYLYVVGDKTQDTSKPVSASTTFETNSAKYFAPHAFKIKFTQFDDNFTITPYWITPDGLRVNGVARTRNMIENLEEYSYAEVNGRAYYSDSQYSALNVLFTTAINETMFVGTEENPAVITLLKEELTVTAIVGASDNRSIVDKSVVIQNKKDMNVTISRGDSYKGTMFDYFNDIQLGSLDESDSGTLIVDGYSANAISGRTVNIRGGRKFVLAKNATLQNANCTASGAAIVNRGTCDLYGNLLNNQSSATGSEAGGFAAGAILQCRQNGTPNATTIYSGQYSGNKNSSDVGRGGLFGTQITNESEGAAGPITIAGGTFSGNSANEGGVIYTYSNALVTISDGDFTGNSATAYGGVISTVAGTSTDDGANILISGGTFTSNKAEPVTTEEATEETTAEAHGGVVYLNDYGTLAISNGEFTSNTAADRGGVICTTSLAGNVSIQAGSFEENSAYYGGVAYSYATVDIDDGNFTSNEATQNAGAIFFNGSNSHTIDGGTFSGNSAGNLGGVLQVASTGTVAISQATFQENSAKSGGAISTSASAGAITIGAGTSFTSNNATANGGAIVVNTTKHPLTINGGTFTENSAGSYGGVVHVARSATLAIAGGSFTENSATTYGGVASTAEGSTASNGATINVTAGEFTSNTGTTYGGVIYVNKSGTLDIDGGTFSGNSATTDGGVVSTAEGFKTTTDEETSTETTTELPITVTFNGGTFTENSATTDGGVVYLNKYTNLTVNGGVFTSNSSGTNGGVISTAEGSGTGDGAEVIINNGEFSSNSGKYGGVAFVHMDVTLDINGGTFNENSATSNGGVIVTKTGTSSTLCGAVTISDGEFTSNSASQYGGVVHLGSYGTLTIDKGSFTKNTSNDKGGVVNINSYGTLTVDGGTFKENTSTVDGGVVNLNAKGTLIVNAGTFSENNATESGGVISAQESAGTVTIKTGSFTGNSAGNSGGVVYVGTASLLTIEDGTFTGNTADTYGGVVGTVSGELTLKPNIIISDGTFSNNSANAGGAIYAWNRTTLTVEGGEFTNNEATEMGAGAVFAGDYTKVTISNATMTGNCAPVKSTYFGGGAMAIHGSASVTIGNCNISGNSHAGILADAEKNTDGFDITFTGQGSNKTQTLTLSDATSFNGIVGHVFAKGTTAVIKMVLTGTDGSQVTFASNSTDEDKMIERDTRYTVDYDTPALVKKYDNSVVLVSDMHYTTESTQAEYLALYPDSKPSVVSGSLLGYTQDEKIQAVFSDINSYATQNVSIDAVMLLGDLSIDNKGYSNLHQDFLRVFKETYLDPFNYSWYALAGNHDSYTESQWSDIMGRSRQYSVEIGNAVFIMLDTFAAANATTSSGSDYVGVDTSFLATELAKEAYADKTIFLCSHYYSYEKEQGVKTEEELATLTSLMADERIVCMFRGHSHNSRNITPSQGEPLYGKKLVDIGGYAYNPEGVNGDYNVFQETYAWGYQVLEWDESEVHLYHVKPARTYTDSTGTHNYAGVEKEYELTIPLQ